MARNHLRQHAGGNPAQGPAPDVANPTPPPAAGDDFPDDPSGPAGPVQDQPDLDAFAERLGLTDTATATATDDASGTDDPSDAGRSASATLGDRARSVLGATASKLASGLDAMSGRLRRLAERTNDTGGSTSESGNSNSAASGNVCPVGV